MQCHLELIREILVQLDNADDYERTKKLKIEGYTDEFISLYLPRFMVRYASSIRAQ